MPLQLGLQVPGVEGSVHDAVLRGLLGQLVRQEDIADLGLAVVHAGAPVVHAAVVVEHDAVRLRAGNVHGDRARPRDAYGSRRRRGRGLGQEGNEELVEEVVTKAVCARLQVVSLGVKTAFWGKHNLSMC